MSMIVDFQPIGIKIEIDEGTSLLEAAQNAGIGLTAICGGKMACGTCVVRLESGAKANEPTSVEKKKLSEEKLAAGFRLACQTRITESAVIDIPLESMTTPQRTQVEGEEEEIPFEPSIRSFDLEFEDAMKTDLHSDWEKIRDALIAKGIEDPGMRALKTHQQIPSILRDNDWRIKVVTHHDNVANVSAPNTPVLGLAVDVGTTKIAGYLIDMTNGETLAKQGIMNPQISYGEDVMARITYIMENENGGETLQKAVVDGINKMVVEMCKEVNISQRTKDKELPAYDSSQIVEAVLVGNTAIHHILMGLPVRQLGLAPYISAVSTPMDSYAAEIGLKAAPGANVHLLPNIAGFVGADHVSMLLATGVQTEKQTTLFIDIGTNTEISLKTPKKMVSCSAASGPAFEGAHIANGMRAADGAIERVKIDAEGVHYQTINNTEPVGICGSGIIDAIAQMIDSEVINRRGGFNEEHPFMKGNDKNDGLVIASAEETKHKRSIGMNRKDVSEIQLAKGAIRAGIELMMTECEIEAKDIEKVIIAGAFGSFINIRSALTLGIFPKIDEDKFIQVGNAAGIGAKQALMSCPKRKESQVIAQSTTYLELSTHPDFSTEFAKGMFFE